MPSPYKTNCFDYDKIGCKSRRDCVDRWNVEFKLKHCNGLLPLRHIFVDKHINKDIFKDECDHDNKEHCEQKYKSTDCLNEYYTIKLVSDKKLKEYIRDEKIDEYLKLFDKSNFKSNNKNAKADINLISQIYIDFNNEPDTIYTHSPQQYPIEFICLIGGIISLWTGFSVYSIYASGKQIFNRKQNKIEQIDQANVSVNNYNQIHNHFHNQKHFVFINNKMNDKISMKKLRKIVKKKNCVINQVNINKDN